MENDGGNEQKGGSALQFTEGIDQLCDLIISKLEERWNRGSAFQAGCREFESRLPLFRFKIRLRCGGFSLLETPCLVKP